MIYLRSQPDKVEMLGKVEQTRSQCLEDLRVLTNEANAIEEKLNQAYRVATQAKALVSRGQMLKHPAVVLHELAHAYHDQFLSFDHPDVISCFNKAKEAGEYNKVMLFTGQTVKHYAMTNHKEYFAEVTEAFFGKNDFYPFTLEELQKHDPGVVPVLKKKWGVTE